MVVWRLDRLGRSLPHLIETVGDLEVRGVGFKSSRARPSSRRWPPRRRHRDMTSSLGVAESCVYGWKFSDRVDLGLEPARHRVSQRSSRADVSGRRGGSSAGHDAPVGMNGSRSAGSGVDW